MTNFFPELKLDSTPAAARKMLINQKKKDLRDIRRYYTKGMELVHAFEEKIKKSQDVILDIDRQLGESSRHPQRKALLEVRLAHENYIKVTLEKINPNIEILKSVAEKMAIIEAQLSELNPKRVKMAPGA